MRLDDARATWRRAGLALALLVLAPLSTGCSGAARPPAGGDGAPPLDGPPGQTGRKIEILRDTWGIPHIFATTDEDAMYGLGWATAEDRAFQMYYALRIIQGRLAEVVGVVSKVRSRSATSLANDRKMRTFGFHRAAKRLVQKLDRGSLALLTAYAAGVNDYIAKHRARLPALFKKLGLVPEPWTPADSLLAWWHLAQFFATDGTRDMVAYRKWKAGGRTPRHRIDTTADDNAAAVVQREDVTQAWIDQTRAFARKHEMLKLEICGETPKFSHAWVVGKARSKSGAAILCSDPQTPVANPSLFYQWHVKGKTFDVRGVGVPGSPIVLIGFSRDVAWGMTALGADQADLFRLKTDPGRKDQYQLDGKWLPMRVIKETIAVKGGRPQTLTIRETRFGPIVSAFAFLKRGEPEVALSRVPMVDTDKETIQGAIAMMRARSAAEFARALGGWRFPSANVVFGDKAGVIGYQAVGAIPVRSPLAPNVGQAAQDGSATKFAWRGFIPPALMPRSITIKRGWAASANHRPIANFYRIPLGNLSGACGDGVRSLRLRELLTARSSFSYADVKAVHEDRVNPARRDIVRFGLHLRDVLRKTLSAAAARALARLEPWFKAGARSDLSVPGAELAQHIRTYFRESATRLATDYGGGNTGLARFLKHVQRRLKADPKAALTALEQSFVDGALAAAWQTAQRLYGSDTKSWPTKARAAVRRRTLGYYQSLDGFPSLDRTQDVGFPALADTDGGTINSQASQAYTQCVDLKNPDAAEAIMPIGQSERPGDASRKGTLDLWGRGKLHPAPISRAAVEKITKRREVLWRGK